MTEAGWRWMDKAAGGGMMDERHPVRRVWGMHEIRFDGISDLLLRAHGASVFDVGCNRGHLGWDFAMNGARLVHGCDIDGASIQVARHWFSEHPHVESKFEVVDLRGGADAVTAAFGKTAYDIVLLMGVTHKLNRVMDKSKLDELVTHLGGRASTYFAWAGYADGLTQIDAVLPAMARIHTSELAKPGQPAAIWRRK